MADLEAKGVTEGEFGDWTKHPVTQKMYSVIGTFRDDIANALINGSSLKGGNATIEETAKMVGILYGADLFMKAEWGMDNE